MPIIIRWPATFSPRTTTDELAVRITDWIKALPDGVATETTAAAR